MEELVAVLTKYPNIKVFSDEIYEKLNFSGRKHISLASHPELSERTFTINGFFKKSHAMTGWRIGYVHCLKNFVPIVSKIAQHWNTNVPTFIQKALITSFSIDNNFINEFNFKLSSNATEIMKVVSSLEELELVSPQGGLFCFMNIKKTGINSDEFSSGGYFKKKKVATIPGKAFGDDYDDHIRISLITGHDKFNIGLERIVSFVNQLS